MWFELLGSGNPCIAASHPVGAYQMSTLGQIDTFSIQVTIIAVTIKEDTIRVVYLPFCPGFNTGVVRVAGKWELTANPTRCKCVSNLRRSSRSRSALEKVAKLLLKLNGLQLFNHVMVF